MHPDGPRSATTASGAEPEVGPSSDTDSAERAEPEVEAHGGRRASEQVAGSAVDTHCHLFLMEQEPAEAIAEARAAGVATLVCVGIDPDSSRRSLELAESFRGAFATAGVHPHTASEFDRAANSVIEELVAHPLVVGVGETGLDYYRRLSPMEDQHRAFRGHIALSRETGKPLVVHVRDAWDDALSILGEEGAEHVVLHCFSGDAAVAAEALRRGYFVSFAGNVTYPNAEGLRRAAAAVDSERLLVETDSPFLTPQPFRGTPNTPAHLPATISEIARIRGATVDVVTARTAAASREAFPLIR